MSQALKGLVLGAVAVLIFSLTMPVTKIALAGGGMTPWFIWAGRAALGAIAGAVYLLSVGARLPPRAAWWPLLGTTVGVVFGWPLLNTIALQTAPASHAAVVNGLLPLTTAVIGGALAHERMPRLFWLCAIGGTAVVCGYAWFRAEGTLHLADAMMLAGVLFGGLGYGCGALATRHLGGLDAISWALILGLPVTSVAAAINQPVDAAVVAPSSWIAFAYLGLMSQWFGFLFWYRGLVLGGIARVSQVQLLQLFATLGFSALILGEEIELSMLIVAIMTLVLIFIGRRAKPLRVNPDTHVERQ